MQEGKPIGSGAHQERENHRGGVPADQGGEAHRCRAKVGAPGCSLLGGRRLEGLPCEGARKPRLIGEMQRGGWYRPDARDRSQGNCAECRGASLAAPDKTKAA